MFRFVKFLAGVGVAVAVLLQMAPARFELRVAPSAVEVVAHLSLVQLAVRL